jgi:hypothetical protein
VLKFNIVPAQTFIVREVQKMGTFLDDFVKDFTKNQLIAYFLMFWAATFFLGAISTFIWLVDGYTSAPRVIVEGLYGLAKLGCAAVLVMLGVKILNQTEDKQE